MKVAVVGLGKIGLPLAAHFASKGHHVTGVDIQNGLVRLINDGIEPFPGETGLAELLQTVVSAGSLSATTDFGKAIPEADVVVVAVPLMINANDEPDFHSIDSATESIGRNLTTDTLVIYETTLPIGTTRGRWKPKLEHHSGLTEGQGFNLVFSPERVLTGRIFDDLGRYPKLVGALSTAGAESAKAFYGSVLDFEQRHDLAAPNGVWDLGSPEAAEFAKLAETTYRDVNIALANQFARHAEEVGVDIYEVIQACNSQPFSHIHNPGISVGGHCIPVYPRLYSYTDRNLSLVKDARRINAGMPALAVKSVCDEIGSLDGRQVLILGVSYRGGVKETAFSGAFSLVGELEKLGASVQVLDPLFSDVELVALGLKVFRNKSWPHVVILHSDHESFKAFESADFPNVEVVYDGRNFLDKANWNATKMLTLGRGTTA